MLLKLLISFHILSEKETRKFSMGPSDDSHLSNPGLRVHNPQMFGRTLANLARRSGPHTIDKNGVRESKREMAEVSLLTREINLVTSLQFRQ